MNLLKKCELQEKKPVQVSCWVILKSKSSAHHYTTFQLCVVNSNSDKLTVNGNFLKFRYTCPDEETFIWQPGLNQERVLPLSQYGNLPEEHSAKLLQVCKTAEKRKLTLTPLSKEAVLGYSEQPSEAYLKGYRYFIVKVCPIWGISEEIAIKLISGKNKLEQFGTETFNDAFNLHFQHRLLVVLEIEGHLEKRFSQDHLKKRTWLNTARINFDNLTPLELMEQKDEGIHKVQQNAAWIGQSED